MKSTKVLDAKGLACPMPIVKTKKEINGLKLGEILEIHVTDKGAINDLAAWSKSSGHELVKHEVDDDHILKFWIRKG